MWSSVLQRRRSRYNRCQEVGPCTSRVRSPASASVPLPVRRAASRAVMSPHPNTSISSRCRCCPPLLAATSARCCARAIRRTPSSSRLIAERLPRGADRADALRSRALAALARGAARGIAPVPGATPRIRRRSPRSSIRRRCSGCAESLDALDAAGGRDRRIARRRRRTRLTVAERLAADLAARGLVVVSGLARGVDSAAHRGALAAADRRSPCSARGVDVIYPAEHAPLARGDRGRAARCVSELVPGTPPQQQFFPLRNRIISGLSRAVVDRRSRREERIAHHRALRARSGTRRAGGAGQRAERPESRRPRAAARRCKDCGVGGRYLGGAGRAACRAGAARAERPGPARSGPGDVFRPARRAISTRSPSEPACRRRGCCRGCSSSKCRVWCGASGGGRFVRV